MKRDYFSEWADKIESEGVNVTRHNFQESEPKVKVVKHSFDWFSLIGVILILAKLFGFTNLSWFWVLAPFWIPILIGVGIVLITVIVALIISYLL